MHRSVGIAWIAEQVLTALRAEADHAFPLETGGVLLGYWATLPEEVVIADAIGPGPQALHGERRFRPDRDYQEAEIARRYEESGRYHTYLGDWHTHPRTGPRLSGLDRRTLRSIARDRDARAPVPLMAVLGGGITWDLVVWCLVPRSHPLPVFRSRILPFQPRPFPMGVG